MNTSNYYTLGTTGPPPQLLPVSFSCTHTHMRWYRAVTGRDMRRGGGGQHYALMVRSINHKMMKAISFI